MKFLTHYRPVLCRRAFSRAKLSENMARTYGWGISTCILRAPPDGTAALLSPGACGHGGAGGTQAWIDPVKGGAYILMEQRSNFPNGDASDVRRQFQQTAANALAKP